ncbi:hypothetical protein M0811_13718 [Anaeramoeba ignava]|uniref:Band 7 domain-containing protein n=1 Tax=Anaeramoeba ignava TaxID=1746090 RepID=A0A9Q0R452_ANAIG|nr:hypothetical protein M0811_13718 [Anaeramoeba ignava]
MSDPIGAWVGGYVALFIVLLVIWIMVAKCCRVVRHSEVMILERWGKYKKTLLPGAHLLVPFIDSPRKIHWRYPTTSNNYSVIVREQTDRVDMREHVIVFGSQPVISRDNVSIKIDALVYYQINDPKLAVYAIQNLPDAIELLTQTSLRNIMAHLTLDESFSSRELINIELKQQIERDANRWGIIIHRCEVFNISPPNDILSAMEYQIREERERRATILLADGERESEIIRSRGTAAKIVLLAEGSRTSQIQQAKGLAESKILISKAEARSVTAIREAIKQSNVKATDYLITVQYLRALTNALKSSSSSSLVLVPQEILDELGQVTQKK